MTVPDTRHSLILRLPDRRDVEAWDEFTAIYEPLVYRLARGKGFQDADAQEIVQEVLMSVAKAIQRWDPSRQRGRFRDWLFRIARNLMINFLTRRTYQPIGSGDSAIAELLHVQCDPTCDESVEFDLEYRRELFRWAARQVRPHVREQTWDAFWSTSVDGRAIADVARELGISVGAVYIARSRVMGRLNEVVSRLEQTDSND